MNNITFGKNQFCGPSVISAITGITTDDAERIIQSVRNGKATTKAVKGVWNHELIKAFNILGYECRVKNGHGSLYLNLLTLHDGIYVFVVPGHYICIESSGPSRKLCDNHTKTPLNAATSARLMQKVEQIIEVVKA